ncbi:PEP-CTERM sorting domain-containing protein [Lacipirellula sp.]|uniref:PEP-CTERM sorting domain-containing protein n=1 Tax=Lacipirellula sp. TaxID=2691419 RepID=UPI003D11B4EF
MQTKAFLPGLLAVCLVASAARAASYSEFVAGDLSSNPLQPTPFALTPGVNDLLGEASSKDFDFLQITIPANHVLGAITVTFHEDMNPVFAGIQQGAVWTAGAGTEVIPSAMLGWVNFPTNPQLGHVGENILDDIALGAGATGFTPPLASGAYTMLFQTRSVAVRYGLSFRVAPVNPNRPGDFNGDTVVDGADLAIWRAAFNQSDAGDANSDGVTDGADLLIWQRNSGLTGAASTAHAVPEPSAALLAIGACAGLVARRRRRA